MKSNAAKFESPEVRNLVQRMERIGQSPEARKLENVLRADSKRFFVKRVIPVAIAAEALAVALTFAFGFDSASCWSLAAVTAAVLVGVVACRPR